MSLPSFRPRVAAVSYLNTVPLVWGFLHGPQGEQVDLSFRLPSECSDDLRCGRADIGLLPVIEMARQNLAYCPGTGIACEGAVRSILLVSKVPPQDIRRMAVDRGSRTSVMLARIILQEKYGAAPIMTAATPDLDAMLSDNDAALIIGDPALHIDPEELPYLSLDLGSEWTEMTDLPMVFAVWSGHERFTGAPESRMFADALRHGLDHLPDIIAENSVSRALPAERVHRYLTHHIQFELSGRHYEGLRTYLRFAAGLEPGLLANLEVPAAL